MNQKTTIAAIVLATILTASVVVMALPWESAEASRDASGGDARGGDGGDAMSEAVGGDAENTGDSETNDNDNNAGDYQVLVISQKAATLLVAQQQVAMAAMQHR